MSCEARLTGASSPGGSGPRFDSFMRLLGSAPGHLSEGRPEPPEGGGSSQRYFGTPTKSAPVKPPLASVIGA